MCLNKNTGAGKNCKCKFASSCKLAGSKSPHLSNFEEISKTIFSSSISYTAHREAYKMESTPALSIGMG